MKNLITRTLVGIVFLAIMIGGILWRPDTMILIFIFFSGLTMWEYTGLVNDYVEGAQINRLISTVAGIYLVLAVAGIQIGLVYGAMAFVPYIITVVYSGRIIHAICHSSALVDIYHVRSDVYSFASVADKPSVFQNWDGCCLFGGIQSSAAFKHLYLPVDKRYRSVLLWLSLRQT